MSDYVTSDTRYNMTNTNLIIIYTVRKDYFDEHARRLRELADIEFERCSAPSSWSISSHASMFAGELPHRHGVPTYNPDNDHLDSTFLDDLGSFCEKAEADQNRAEVNPETVEHLEDPGYKV